MAVTFQAVGTAVSATTGTLTVAWPAHVANDIALLWVTSSGSGTTETLATANGFTLITTQSTGTGTAGTKLSVYWARATSSAMAAPVVTAGSDFKYGVITTYRGARSWGSPIDVSAGAVKATASTTASPPAVTTLIDDDLVVMGISSDLDSASAFLSAITNSGLASVTERFDAGTTSGLGGGIAVAEGRKTAAAATGTTTATVTSSINAMITVALAGEHPQHIGFTAALAVTSVINSTPPVAYADGDLFISYIAYGTGVTATVPDGWRVAYNESSGDVQHLVLWRFLTNPDTSPGNITFSAATPVWNGKNIWRGAHPTDPMDAFPVTSDSGGVNTTALSAPSITATTAQSSFTAYFTQYNDVDASATTMTTTTGGVSAASVVGSSAVNRVGRYNRGEQVGAGATGAFAGTSNKSKPSAGATLAIRSLAETGAAFRAGMGTATINLAASGVGAPDTPPLSITGSGTATIKLAASGVPVKRVDGSRTATLKLAASASSANVRTGSAAATLKLAATRTATSTRTSTRTAPIKLVASGVGAKVAAGTRTAPFTLTATGTPAATHTGTRTATLRLTAEGISGDKVGARTAIIRLFASSTQNSVRTGAATATLKLTATRTAAPVRAGTRTATLKLASTGTGIRTHAATGTATFHLALTVTTSLQKTSTATGTMWLASSYTATSIRTNLAAAILLLLASGVGVKFLTQTNITVTARLLPRRWDADLTPRDKTGALLERDNTGTLLERTNTGTLTPRRWEGTTTQ